jgi:hypothetical protein
MCVNCGCSSCNTNSYVPDNTSALKYDGPKFVCPSDFTVLPGAPLNDMLNTLMGKICANASSVDSVTGLDTDNTDPENPIVQIAVDGVTITGEGTPASPLVSVGGGGGQVDSVVAGTNITVDNTDPINPIINASGGGGFTHYLGEEFEGGIIYHLYKDSLGVEHGLIVNKTEQGALKWQNIGTATTAVRTEDGVFNTNLMTDSPVADYVNALTDGGFTDWYLPSIDESNLLYDNRFNTNKALRSGAFTLLSTATYWSSTEVNTGGAYILNSISGNAAGAAKDSTTVLTRAIRSF